MTVLAIGACRTGGSYLSSLLEADGIDFGDVQRERVDGPKGVLGYYEHPVLHDVLRQQINASGGFSGFCPPDRVLPLAQPIRFPAGGYKAEALSWALPWWLEHVFPDAHVIVSVRHPMEMALSNHRLRNVPVEQGLARWKRTYQDIELWERIYGAFSWVAYPTTSGYEQALAKMGLTPSGQTPQWHPPKTGRTPLPPGFEYMDNWYQSMVERIENVDYEARVMAG